jgi:hypothetical protein
MCGDFCPRTKYKVKMLKSKKFQHFFGPRILSIFMTLFLKGQFQRKLLLVFGHKCSSPWQYKCYSKNKFQRIPKSQKWPKYHNKIWVIPPKLRPELGQNWARIGPELGQNWARIWSEWGQNGARMGPEWGKNWARIGPKWGKNWPELGKNWQEYLSFMILRRAATKYK